MSRTAPDTPRPTPHTLVQRYATLPEQTAALSGAWRLFRAAGVAGAVPYRARFGVALCPGDPLCAPADLPALLGAFLRACRAAGWHALLAPASARCAAAARTAGGGAWKAGEEPFIDLAHWTLAGRAGAPLRESLNHARGAGVSVREWSPACGEGDVLTAVWRAWRRHHSSPPLGFVLAGSPLEAAPGRRWFVARRDDRVEGFATTAALPARNAVAVEHFVRRPDAPRGVVELLVVEALRRHQVEGARVGTLGATPFRGIDGEAQPPGATAQQRIATAAMLAVWSRGARLYRTSTLERFKRKFSPSWWEPVYAVYCPAAASPRLGAAMLLELLPGGPPAWGGSLVQSVAGRLSGATLAGGRR